LTAEFFGPLHHVNRFRIDSPSKTGANLSAHRDENVFPLAGGLYEFGKASFAFSQIDDHETIVVTFASWRQVARHGFGGRVYILPEGRHDGPVKLEPEALAHLDDLYAFALRLSQDPVRAEDLVQDTLVRALTQAGEPPLAVRPYLFRCLRNLHIDHWRRQQRLQREPSWSEQSTCALSEAPEHILLHDMLSDWLEEALARLELPLRETLWLREVEGFSYAEISLITEAPLNTVRSRLARARSQMQAWLDGTPPVPEPKLGEVL
jgi:RNA polymerase sigma-70 factor (ECF subfamily)